MGMHPPKTPAIYPRLKSEELFRLNEEVLNPSALTLPFIIPVPPWVELTFTPVFVTLFGAQDVLNKIVVNRDKEKLVIFITFFT